MKVSYFLRGRWPGRIFRASLAALPLVAVLGLCVMMVGWRGKSSAQELDRQPVSPTAGFSRLNDAGKSAEMEESSAFQRRHILHAVIRVPQ